MKLIQILNKENVRGELLEYWMNNNDNMETVKERCDKILNKYGYDESFKYQTYYEQLNPLASILAEFHRDEELVAREIAIQQKAKRVNREKAYVHRVLNYDTRFTQFEEIMERALHTHVSPEIVYNEPLEEIDEPIRVFLSDFHHKVGNESVISDCINSVLRNVIGDFELILTGDMIQGCLRDADIIDGNVNIDEQALTFADTFCNSLLELLPDSLGILRRIVIIPGNHDRINLTSYKGAKVPSMAKIIGGIIDIKLSDIEVLVQDEYVYEDVQRTTTIVTHGHLTGGIKNLRKYYGNDVKVIHAHFHHYYKDDNIMGLPPICESNEFEKSLGIPDDIGRKYIMIDNGWIREVKF